MKATKLTPRNVAPVQRENSATVSRDGNAISALYMGPMPVPPFAGDDAE